jgi:hypothetical protein
MRGSFAFVVGWPIACGANSPSDPSKSSTFEEKLRKKTYLKFSIGPARNLNNHVQDGLLLVGIEGDIVEGGDWNAILLDIDSVLEGVGSSDLADAVLRSHCDLITT